MPQILPEHKLSQYARQNCVALGTEPAGDCLHNFAMQTSLYW